MKLFGKKNKSEKKPDEPVQQTPQKHPMQIGFEKNLKFMNQETYPVEFIQGLFTETGSIKTFTAGNADFPTGRVVLADPLAYLGSKYETVLEETIPAGSYPVELSIFNSELAGLRVAAARLKITDGRAVSYTLAQAMGYSDPDIKPKPLCFMGVDAGMGCITDKAVSEEYDKFLAEWHAQNPGGNHYDDYFKELLEDSYRKCPDYQTPYGDFLLWKLPESKNALIIFSSGLGDGIYCGYWGVDENGEKTELVMPFINPEFF